MIIYGPVPSRRLGFSLGINNIPPKVCSYSCVYCQLGRTKKMQQRRESFYDPEEMLKLVKEKVQDVASAGDTIDYATFVADGEPTLDINLGQEIAMLKEIGLKTAVITNASLLGNEEVRDELRRADWVSLKIDGVGDEVWRKIDRPLKTLNLAKILSGVEKFAQSYQGRLVTETMLVTGINDSLDSLKGVAEFLAKIKPHTAYISMPIRPPAESFVKCPDEKKINQAYQIFAQQVENVELLIGYEGNQFSITGDIKESILNIASVHPIREEGMSELLAKGGNSWKVVTELLAANKLQEIFYNDKKFYLRKFN